MLSRQRACIFLSRAGIVINHRQIIIIILIFYIQRIKRECQRTKIVQTHTIKSANYEKIFSTKQGNQNKITFYVNYTINSGEKENGSEFRTQNEPIKNIRSQEKEQQQDFELDICLPNIITKPIKSEKTKQASRQKIIVQNNQQCSKNNFTQIKEKYVQNQKQQNKQKQKMQSQANQRNQSNVIQKKQQQEKVKKEHFNFNNVPFVFQVQDQQLEQKEQSKTTQAEKSPQPVEAENEKQNCVSEQQSLSESHQSQRQIKGVTITSTSLQGNVAIKIINKKQLVLSRLPPGIILKCLLRKSSNIFYPEYDFYLNNGMKHMLSAKKNSLSNKQIFKLSLQLGKYKSKDVIGTIMANTVHSVYWTYKQTQLDDEIQYEVKGTVRYEKLINNEPRKMKVQLHTDNSKQTKIDAKYVGHENQIEADLVLNNILLKQKQSSIKNFALIDSQDSEYQYLKMNKVSENMFQVEIQHPLSPLQAFAISLTRFDAQLK